MAMRTNREKYEYYCAEIEAKDRAAIAALVPVTPSQFYTIRAYEAVAVEVTGLGVHRSGIYKHDESDRVTKAEVELAARHAAEWVAPTLDTLFVHYRDRQAIGTVTGAHPYSKIEADAGMAWQAENLAPEIERRRALYAPRDGHTACAYCRTQTPTDRLVSRTIYYRDRGGSQTKVGQYCTDQCGYYDQCGHEG
jgi:hypothetical protein